MTLADSGLLIFDSWYIQLYIALRADTLCYGHVVSTATSVERRSMMWPWIFGTLVKIARTSAWRTWSTDSGPKRWSLKVRCQSRLNAAATLAVCVWKIEFFSPPPIHTNSPFQVALLRVTWCPATWSTSLCPSCPSSTATSNCARATPSQPEACRWMRRRWTRSPRRCCTSPKRSDCSRPRGASPYPSGSTSFSRRGRIAWPEGGVRSLDQPGPAEEMCSPLSQARRNNARVPAPSKDLQAARSGRADGHAGTVHRRL